MKMAIVYASKSGFTKNYAKWLSENLSAELIELSSVANGQLEDYDLLIYGGGLYAGGINGLKKFKKMTLRSHPQKTIYFATGASPNHPEVLPTLLKMNFKADEATSVNLFYLRGGFDISKLTRIDRVLMQLLRLKLMCIKESKRTVDERGMLATYDHAADFTNVKYIEPILAVVKSMEVL